MTPGKREVPRGPYTRKNANFYSVEYTGKGSLTFDSAVQMNVPIVFDECTKIVYLFCNGTLTNYYGPHGKPCTLVNGKITECL